jgi:hypothetical protein
VIALIGGERVVCDSQGVVVGLIMKLSKQSSSVDGSVVVKQAMNDVHCDLRGVATEIYSHSTSSTKSLVKGPVWQNELAFKIVDRMSSVVSECTVLNSVQRVC